MRYLSLFSGIGGFELGIQQAYEIFNLGRTTGTPDSEDGRHLPLSDDSNGNGRRPDTDIPECVGFSEIDKYATQIYQKHFPTHKNYGDITKINAEELPDFDLLCGGFPCQSFSIAGKRRGFEDTRGTLFFDIARILQAKRPRLFLLENVKGLLSHGNGDTFKTIISTLTELGYDVQWQVLNSKNFGVPQNRERVFIVGNRRGTRRPNVFPLECSNDNLTINEKVYAMQEGLSSYAREFLLGMAQSKEQKLSISEMQGLFKAVKQGIQESECREVEREPQNIRQESEGDIQEVETLDSFLGSANHTKDFRGVVSIPTEDMLLLWTQGGGLTQRVGQLQQQNEPIDSRQARLDQTLRSWEHSSLLFAVQPYQGQLLYSIGDGRDWVKIYQTKVEIKCKENNLSSILEEHVDPKYFLSSKAVEAILNTLGESFHLDKNGSKTATLSQETSRKDNESTVSTE